VRSPTQHKHTLKCSVSASFPPSLSPSPPSLQKLNSEIRKAAHEDAEPENLGKEGKGNKAKEKEGGKTSGRCRFESRSATPGCSSLHEHLMQSDTPTI